MNLNTEAAIIEAILFLEGEPVGLDKLARVGGLSKDVLRAAMEQLQEKYADPQFGLEIVHVGEGYAFAPKQEFWEVLKDHYGKKNENKLSRAAMETLSIIAYSQPITKAEIENIRGVSSDGMIKLLLQRSLIRETGRKEAPGRPVLYGTTREFLKLFRLSSLSELPKLEDIDKERFELNG
ncbi:SMC-Scp complex subunit ScpB [Spirochaeta africana]|uniref:Segregation and condensation protein B n=1 Tax=Spirochaeta africana (strain ATCC 700263 / DSM 8902 / Z-7692) TaxID=889378 RepID=H9UJ84_SPIAZ|nr:SMC-Scp complex subunit ScpB [Spirochaeta africana]AFG37577.1 segregation and condensation protein B [Spirochaeta africana DSM 8902]